MRWIDLIIGTETVVFSARERRIATAVMMRAGLTARSVKNTDDGGLTAELRRRDYRHLCALLAERGLAIPQSVSANGMPRLLRYLKRRPGLPVGAVLALAIWVISTLFVWRVDVICLDNAQGTAARDRVDVVAIQQDLAEAGIGQGLFLPDLDSRRLENRFLLGREDISWMAINRRGTTLSVEVRPAHPASKDREPSLTVDEEGYLHGTNLVADADGRILSFSVHGGQMVAGAEQMVLRGSLLASGVYTSETGDTVAGRAHGEVLAETVRVLQTEVPLTEQVQKTTGKTRKSYTLKLFGRDCFTVSSLPDLHEIVTFLETFQKTGEKSGIDDGSCGIITDETISDAKDLPLYLPGGLPLPVSVRMTTLTETAEYTISLTEDAALQRARAGLDADEAALAVIRVLSRDEVVERHGDHLTVTRYVSCIDNIAVEEEFRIKPQQ